jgi:hypothetical protein
MSALENQMVSREDSAQCHRTHARHISVHVHGFMVKAIHHVVFVRGFHRSRCENATQMVKQLVQCAANPGGMPVAEPSPSRNAQRYGTREWALRSPGDMKTPFSMNKNHSPPPNTKEMALLHQGVCEQHKKSRGFFLFKKGCLRTNGFMGVT